MSVTSYTAQVIEENYRKYLDNFAKGYLLAAWTFSRTLLLLSFNRIPFFLR